MAYYKKGVDDVRPPEKTNHLPHFNNALTKALAAWQPGDPTEVDVLFQASISPNPGGVGQYRIILTPQTQTFADGEEAAEAP
jgi:hypothetical protein